MIRIALVLGAVAVLAVPTYAQTPKVPEGWKLADPDAQNPATDAPTKESSSAEERLNKFQVRNQPPGIVLWSGGHTLQAQQSWLGIIEGSDHFKELSESGAIAKFPPRNPEEALLRLMWSTRFEPPLVIPTLVDAYILEWGDSCPQSLKWDGVISHEQWRDLYLNGNLINFPPRTMPEAMMRASWIARFLPSRWATTILALYTDLYRRGFGDACAPLRR